MDRFWNKVAPEPDERGCLLWLASLDAYGYGQFRLGNRVRKAHQVALELAGISVPKGMEPDHTCKVRACVNVEHLEIVTHAENNRRIFDTDYCQAGLHRWDQQTPVASRSKPGRRECRPCRLARRRQRHSEGRNA